MAALDADTDEEFGGADAEVVDGEVGRGGEGDGGMREEGGVDS